jgi:hypothetical protein
MKLNLDLARAILLHIEAAPPNQDVGPIRLEGYDEDEVLAHLELLTERDLIDANLTIAGSGAKRIYAAYVKSLTWEGHEFLDNARNEEVWSRTKALVKERGGSASFEIVKALLTEVALKFFNLGTYTVPALRPHRHSHAMR